MNRKLYNQNGLTLVELLAVIALTAIVSILLFSITTKAIETTKIINQETILRDEADIIISKFIKALYPLKQEQIVLNETGEVIADKNDPTKKIIANYLYISNNSSRCERDEKGILKDKVSCKADSSQLGFFTEEVIPKKESLTKIRLLDNEIYSINDKSIKIKPESKIIGNPEDTTIYEIVLVLEISNKRATKTMTFKTTIQPIVK